MPGLEHSLEGHDFAYLRSVAAAWRLDLDATDPRSAARQLVEQIPDLLGEPDELPASCRQPLAELAAAGGRMPWAQFVRSYGELREMGPARLEKERPELAPISLTEQLWYRALIGRAFFDTPDGPREFAYLPDEVLSQLPAAESGQQLGRPARPEERAHVFPASDRILDEAVSLLAALRVGMSAEDAAALEGWRVPVEVLAALLAAAGLAANGKVNAEAARAWLELPRGRALAQLVAAWRQSAEFNELRLMPGLVVEGGWRNDALAARRRVLEFLQAIPAGQWWSLPAFIADIRSQHPDFQRPSGDFDSWYLRDAVGNYLRGFEHWEQVDGAWLAFMLRGPLHWLGLVDLAGQQADAPAAAFRWSAAVAALKGDAPGPEPKPERIKIDSRGLIAIPRLAPRALRYQVARFCDWLPPRQDGYQYQFSARALAGARRQGLKPAQLVVLLKAHIAGSLPPNLLQALKRWEMQGSQASLGTLLVLRLQSQAALKALRASRAARWLGEPIGPLAVEVKPGAARQVLQALLELGYLGEIEGDE